MTFTIKRSKWLRGNGSGKLLRSDGLQCCIGQACTQLGVPDEAIRGIGAVASIENRSLVLDPLFDFATLCEKEWVDRAYGVNDDEYVDDQRREQKLKELAADAGHEFVFVD